MKCRMGCAACCRVISISSPLPGMPDGKPADTICIHLDPVKFICKIWGTSEYPAVCRNFRPDKNYCGTSREEAEKRLRDLEKITAPE